MINDNPIIIDTKSKRYRKQKILCVLCKIELTCINPESLHYKCPRCKNDYNLYYNQILPQEDILESSHESEEEDSVGLLVAEDEFKTNTKKEDSGIKRPKYMQDSTTTKVVEYREY
jgi:hypothetical protein